jgi:hypothetical protein
MQILWRGRAATTFLGASVSAAAIAAVGCHHHRADQYSYAPPYAPPVYTQPQAATPAAYAAAPAGAIPAGAMPAGAMPAGVVPAAPTMAMAAGQPGEVVVASGSPCPPCATEGMVVGATTLIEGGGQTPPCPPGH